MNKPFNNLLKPMPFKRRKQIQEKTDKLIDIMYENSGLISEINGIKNKNIALVGLLLDFMTKLNENAPSYYSELKKKGYIKKVQKIIKESMATKFKITGKI